MNQRDRYWTTLIIWAVFAILIIIIFDRVLLVQADFTGLWPPEQSMAYPLAQDAAQLNQVLAAARDATPALLAQVQQSIHEQIVQRLPLVMALTVALIAAATSCTCFVWRNAGLEAYLAREVVQAEKVKRRSRIEEFVGDLDSDELDQLRSRLGDADGFKMDR